MLPQGTAGASWDKINILNHWNSALLHATPSDYQLCCVPNHTCNSWGPCLVQVNAAASESAAAATPADLKSQVSQAGSSRQPQEENKQQEVGGKEREASSEGASSSGREYWQVNIQATLSSTARSDQGATDRHAHAEFSQGSSPDLHDF